MSTARPYISVVIVGRHDDYGDDFMSRINTFVRSLDHQVRDYPGMFELVVVEWNPLAEKAPLAEVLHPAQNILVRVITVSNELHNQLGAESPVLEFHGKNVGIRRARGEFVLVTNPDILFSNDLIHELAKKKLRIDTVYRTDRCDFDPQGISDVPAESLIDFAVSKTFIVHAMHEQHSVSVSVPESQRQLSLLPKSRLTENSWHTNGCGDFMLAGREVFYTVRGLYETTQHRWHCDSISLYRFAVAKVKQYVFTSPLCVFHQHHDRREQDVVYSQLPVSDLASKPGSTDWGFRGHDMPERTKDPVCSSNT
jgi:hypothetical protein